MSRIPVPAFEHIPAESQALLAGVKSRLGAVPNMYRIIANSPAALEAFLGFYTALDKGEVDSLTRERIALAVAEANGSDYCLSAQTHRVRKAAVTLYETVRPRRFWTFAAGNGETRKGLSLVFAANTRMPDGRRRAA